MNHATSVLERMYIATGHPFWKPLARGTVRIKRLLGRPDMEPLRA